MFSSLFKVKQAFQPFALVWPFPVAWLHFVNSSWARIYFCSYSSVQSLGQWFTASPVATSSDSFLTRSCFSRYSRPLIVPTLCGLRECRINKMSNYRKWMRHINIGSTKTTMLIHKFNNISITCDFWFTAFFV